MRPGIILVVFIGLAIFLGVRIMGEWRKRNEIKNEIARLEEETRRLERRNLEILELSRELSNEEFVEREARLKLGLQKPGETVTVLGFPAGAANVSKSELGEKQASRGRNAKRWWYYFFDHERFGALKDERDSRRPVKSAI